MQKTILIVEDEKSLLKAVSQKLGREGFLTLSATSASEAENQLNQHGTVDAVWLDHYLLNNETGLDLLERMKKNKDWEKIPVFVVSNTVSDDKVVTYDVLGIERYYVKAENKLEDIIKDIKSCLGG